MPEVSGEHGSHGRKTTESLHDDGGCDVRRCNLGHSTEMNDDLGDGELRGCASCVLPAFGASADVVMEGYGGEGGAPALIAAGAKAFLSLYYGA